MNRASIWLTHLAARFLKGASVLPVRLFKRQAIERSAFFSRSFSFSSFRIRLQASFHS